MNLNNELNISDSVLKKKALDAVEQMQSMTVEELLNELECNKNGGTKNNRHNCRLVFENDPLLRGAFHFNQLTEQIDIVKELWWERRSPMITDMDMNYIMLYLEETYGLTNDKIAEKSVAYEADRHRYHPIRDYLNALEWDGIPRIRHILPKEDESGQDRTSHKEQQTQGDRYDPRDHPSACMPGDAVHPSH